MSTVAPESGASEEVAIPAVAADLGTEQVDQTNEQPSTVEEVDTAEMSDAEFSEFMANQLEGVPYAQTTETQTDADAQDQTDEILDTDAETAALEESELAETGTPESYTFKIGEQDITVSDPADIKRLIERGLNSAAEAKATMPAQKMAQMLANNKVTDEATLNKLIDIGNGDMGALRQLLKEQSIDPYDLASPEGEGEGEEYKPKDHSVTASQVELNKVLDSLQDTESFATTADVVMEQWDPASRQEFMDNPKNFTILNNQVADGTYKAISDEMANLDLMGKLPQGKNQFEVYRIVGDHMFTNKLLPGQEAQVEATPDSTPVVDPAQPTAAQRLQQAANTQKRKRAVAPSRSIPQHTNTQMHAPAEVYGSSDAEFQRQTAHLFKNI